MIKVLWNVIKKIFGIITIIFSPLKRLWCRRKRRNSDSILPMTNHYPSVENLSSHYSVNGTGQVPLLCFCYFNISSCDELFYILSMNFWQWLSAILICLLLHWLPKKFYHAAKLAMLHTTMFHIAVTEIKLLICIWLKMTWCSQDVIK